MQAGVNFADYIRRGIQAEIKKYKEQKPKVLPCQVVVRTGNTVTVKLMVNNGYLTPIPDVPICQSPYMQTPIQTGDLGVLIPFDYWSASIFNSGNLAGVEPNEALSIGDCFFLPMLSATNSDTMTDTVIHSMQGTATVTVNDSGGITLDYNGAKVEITAAGITIQDAAGNKVATASSGITIQDAAGNKVETSATGINLQTSGGKSIAMGAESVSINNGNLEVM